MTLEPDPSRMPTPLESPAEMPADTATPEVPLDQPAGTDMALSRRKPLWREYAEAIVVAMLLAFAIRVFIVQAFKIPSGSMIPTLLIGDHILVSKLSYGIQWPGECRFKMALPPMTCYTTTNLVTFGPPQRADVIVFRYPGDEEKDFIKRVVGLPGDIVEVRNKQVWINGALLAETYPQFADPAILPFYAHCTVKPTAAMPHGPECRDNIGPRKVPENSYFVMGDNRDQSLDSRFWGYVREEKIRGRALRIYWSWSGQGSWQEWVRWERIGKAIQ
jgi:signal peptidase I